MEISEIIASYAVGLAILEGLRWGGFKSLTYTLPAFITGSTMIAGIPVDYHRLCVVGIGALVVAALWLFTHYTRVGLGTHFQMVVALLAIILTLILKPSGIFGRQKELEERV